MLNGLAPAGAPRLHDASGMKTLVVAVALALGAGTALAETPLVTGNGFGFAVYSPANGSLSKLYAHPYSFTGPDPNSELGEGLETTSFIKSLTWREAGVGHADYVDDSHVIAIDRPHSRQLYFMPFGLARHALIAAWQGTGAAPPLCIEWAHPVSAQRVERGVHVFAFGGERLIAVPIGPAQDAKPPAACLAGHAAWAFAALDAGDDVAAAVADVQRWQDGKAAPALVERELAALETWRVKPAVTFGSDRERKLWRHSEVVLRMGQSREPNRSNGMIVASLPDGQWFVAWVRDMAYAIDALARMGHQSEARAGIEAYFAAQPVGKMEQQVGAPYQISTVRYFGDGSEEPFFTQEGSFNVELDNFGLVLWVLGEYVDRFHDPSILATRTYRGTIYDSAKRYVVEPLLANLEKYQDGLIVRQDTSIWEERPKDQKHFAFSSAAAIAGLRRFDELAVAQKDTALHTELARVIPLLDKGFAKAFASTGSIHGTLEPGIKNEIDGAVLSAINFGVVTDPAVIRGTVDQMARLQVASGGYRRVHSIIEDPKIYEYWYERQEFLFVDISLAEVYLRLGQPGKAAPLIATIVDKAAKDHDHVPEMYVSVVNPLFKGAIGEPTGAIPMVGYGAGAYISYVLTRQELGFAP